MAPVNQNMKDKGRFTKHGTKDRLANPRPGPGPVNKHNTTWLPKNRPPGGEGPGGSAGSGLGGPGSGRTGAEYRPANQQPRGGRTQKRKWQPDHKVFEGSVGEGQGFAFRRRVKVQHEYNKLLRKERRKHAAVSTVFRDEFPEHLSHLYRAEAETLYAEARSQRIRRTRGRMGLVVDEVLEDETERDTLAESAPSSEPALSDGDPERGVGQGQSDRVQSDPAAVPPDQSRTAAPQTEPEPSLASEEHSLPMSNRQKKKLEKKTSYQKTREEFERIREKRAKKKEEFLKDKQQREEAIQKYKQKKKEHFKVLNTKTRKGQPNLNVQMEYLLQKIQGARK